MNDILTAKLCAFVVNANKSLINVIFNLLNINKKYFFFLLNIEITDDKQKSWLNIK